jgi:hypothetical protein
MKATRREFLKTSCLALGVGLAAPALAIPVRPPPVAWDGIVYTSTLMCPVCHTRYELTIPSEQPLRVFLCSTCLTWLEPKPGDHCLFDSYGTVPCAVVQILQQRAKGIPDWVFSDMRGQPGNPNPGGGNPNQ